MITCKLQKNTQVCCVHVSRSHKNIVLTQQGVVIVKRQAGSRMYQRTRGQKNRQKIQVWAHTLLILILKRGTDSKSPGLKSA